jgi:hypothetical protein
LIETNREIVERARTHVGNLAPSRLARRFSSRPTSCAIRLPGISSAHAWLQD